jgi:hypothetical protein
MIDVNPARAVLLAIIPVRRLAQLYYADIPASTPKSKHRQLTYWVLTSVNIAEKLLSLVRAGLYSFQ